MASETAMVASDTECESELDADIKVDPCALPSKRRARTWIVGISATIVVVAFVAFLLGNIFQANAQFDQAQDSLRSTQQRTSVVVSQIAVVQRDLQTTNGQVSTAAAALTNDTTLLKVIQSALVRAQANESTQGIAINNLQLCLGGVEQALNALAVNDQASALGELVAVTSVCQSAQSAHE